MQVFAQCECAYMCEHVRNMFRPSRRANARNSYAPLLTCTAPAVNQYVMMPPHNIASAGLGLETEASIVLVVRVAALRRWRQRVQEVDRLDEVSIREAQVDARPWIVVRDLPPIREKNNYLMRPEADDREEFTEHLRDARVRADTETHNRLHELDLDVPLGGVLLFHPHDLVQRRSVELIRR